MADLDTRALLDLVGRCTPNSRPAYFAHVLLPRHFLQDPIGLMMPMSEPGSAQRLLKMAYDETANEMKANGMEPTHEGLPFLTNGFRAAGHFAAAILWPLVADAPGQPKLMVLTLPEAVIRAEMESGRPFDQRPVGPSLGARYFTINGSTADEHGSPGGMNFVVEWKVQGTFSFVAPANVDWSHPEELRDLVVSILA
jgi:hypothetical protein